MNLGKKRVVITGVSSGFGAGAATAFADRGYRVWGTMRDAAGRNASKRSALEAHSSEISVLDMDVTDDASVHDAGVVDEDVDRPLGQDLGQPPAHADVLATYGEVAGIPAALGAHFSAFLQTSRWSTSPPVVVRPGPSWASPGAWTR